MRVIMTFILLIGIIGCKNKQGDLKFSLKNETSFKLEDIIVGLPDTTLELEELEPNSRTKWIKVESAYSYGFLKFKDIYNNTYILQPIDYAGETLYKKGSMTFIITDLDTLEKRASTDFSIGEN